MCDDRLIRSLFFTLNSFDFVFQCSMLIALGDSWVFCFLVVNFNEVLVDLEPSILYYKEFSTLLVESIIELYEDASSCVFGSTAMQLTNIKKTFCLHQVHDYSCRYIVLVVASTKALRGNFRVRFFENYILNLHHLLV